MEAVPELLDTNMQPGGTESSMYATSFRNVIEDACHVW